MVERHGQVGPSDGRRSRRPARPIDAHPQHAAAQGAAQGGAQVPQGPVIAHLLAAYLRQPLLLGGHGLQARAQQRVRHTGPQAHEHGVQSHEGQKDRRPEHPQGVTEEAPHVVHPPKIHAVPSHRIQPAQQETAQKARLA